MKNKNNRDYQTASLFFILGLLTLAAVYLLKLVLFSPSLLIEMSIK